MYKDCMSKDNNCNKDCSKSTSCKMPKHSTKSCGSKNVEHNMCPMFVYPINVCDCQIYSILCSCIGKVVGLKLEDSDCILKLRICKVNQCAVMGKTSSGKGPIYVKLNSIQYIDLGKETYVNPLCNIGGSITGTPGPQGANGEKGAMGPQGSQGPKGDKGDMGLQGSQGPKGDKGDMGPQGKQGPKGDIGPKGSASSKGDKGDKGDMGPKGEKGDKGDTGIAPTSPKEKYAPPKKVPYKK